MTPHGLSGYVLNHKLQTPIVFLLPSNYIIQQINFHLIVFQLGILFLAHFDSLILPVHLDLTSSYS